MTHDEPTGKHLFQKQIEEMIAYSVWLRNAYDMYCEKATRRYKFFRLLQIGLAASTSAIVASKDSISGTILKVAPASASADAWMLAIIMSGVVFTILALVFNGYMTEMDPISDIAKLKVSAIEIWRISTKLHNILIKLKEGIVDISELEKERNALIEELGTIYNNSPFLNDATWAKCKKSLFKRKELLLADDEIAYLLPFGIRPEWKRNNS